MTQKSNFELTDISLGIEESDSYSCNTSCLDAGVCYTAFSEETLNLEDKLFPELDDSFNKDILTALNAVSHEEDKTENNIQPHIESEQVINQFIKSLKPASTKYKESLDVKRFRTFFSELGEKRDILDLPADRLNSLLSNFFMKARRYNGKLYDPDTLSSLCRSLQRFLTENGSSVNIKFAPEFALSRRTLAARRKELVTMGLGNKPNACRMITDKEEKLLFELKAFGTEDPVVLQRTMWYLISLRFGYRGREQASELKWGDISLEVDQETKEKFLQWNIRRGSKCESGEKETCPSRKFAPRAYATGLDNCPVAVYNKLKSHRPLETLNTDSPFFLQINRSKKFKPTEGNCRYSTLKMGKNSIIGSLMKSAAIDANLDTGHKKLTNHAVRKTNVGRFKRRSSP